MINEMLLLNVQASAGVPVDDLSTHKVPLLPLHPVATEELDLRMMRVKKTSNDIFVAS